MIRSNGRTSTSANDAALDALYKNFLAQPPRLKWNEVHRIERNFGAITDDECRRAALYSLANSGKRLVEIVKLRSNAIDFARLAESAREYGERLKGLAQMLESAAARIDIALCNRADMRDIKRIVRRSRCGKVSPKRGKSPRESWPRA